MSASELEAGYHRAYREFFAYSSVFRRSLGRANALKRVLYNAVGWRLPALWAPVIALGLIPAVRPVFEFAVSTSARRAAAPAREAGRAEEGMRIVSPE